MTSAKERYRQVRQQIETAAIDAGRDPALVRLLAVSKRQPVSAIAELAALGHTRFGENFVQEACPKIAALCDHALEWHFIGRLQSNKTRDVAAHFSWVHSIDRLKIAQRLNDQRPTAAAPLNVCIEVNISGESGKGGIAAAELPGLAEQIRALPRLKLRGVMALPAPTDDIARQRDSFAALAELATSLADDDFDTLSMGTSGDFAAAIAEGATIVRIGTALFGPRTD
ncbi:MAG: YggS family pyridoxal phosphate-dependent enzyme [Gammaproteobacteria bacterium]